MPEKFLVMLMEGKMKKYEIYRKIVVTLRFKFDLIKALTPL